MVREYELACVLDPSAIPVLLNGLGAAPSQSLDWLGELHLFPRLKPTSWKYNREQTRQISRRRNAAWLSERIESVIMVKKSRYQKPFLLSFTEEIKKEFPVFAEVEKVSREEFSRKSDKVERKFHINIENKEFVLSDVQLLEIYDCLLRRDHDDQWLRNHDYTILLLLMTISQLKDNAPAK